MTRVLVVGDPHGVASELEELGRLFDFVELQARIHNASPVWMGDLFHHHSQVSLPVIDFWRRRFSKVRGHVAISGNHDMPGDGSKVTALQVLADLVEVIDEPTVLEGGHFAAIPYQHTQEDFDAALSSLAPHHFQAVLGHQSIRGAFYESGQSVGDGFGLDRLPSPLFVSGHIHRPQTGETDGRRWVYVGAPRSRTAADADTPRQLLVLDQDQGMLSIPIPAEVCRPINRVSWEEGQEHPSLAQLHPMARVIVKLQGHAAAVAGARLAVLAQRPDCVVRTQILSESGPLATSQDSFRGLVDRWLSQVSPPNGTPAETLKGMLNV